MKKKIVIILWILIGLGLLGGTLLFTAIWRGWIGYVPPLEDLDNPIDKYASQLYSCDGKLLGTYYSAVADDRGHVVSGNRIFAKHDEIAQSMYDALVATEDKRFFEHSGIDLWAMGRAIVKRGILQQSSAGGGSTITQQLAKQLYSATADNTATRLMQKPNEWVIALQLERHYSKDEILTFYLNYFDFLHNAVGIKTAARTYFDTDAKDLTVPQSAMLVGMCKNPAYYNPMRFPDRVKGRRNVVLDLMADQGYISDTDCQAYKSQDLGLRFRRVDHKEGMGAYLRENLRRRMMARKPRASDYASWQQHEYQCDLLAWETDPLYGWCNKNVNRKTGENYNIYTDGLKIYTTIDSRMQQYAEEAVLEGMKVNQANFEREKKGAPHFPFPSRMTAADVEASMSRAIKQSGRYHSMKNAGLSEDAIQKAFRTPVQMTVFTYHGEVDTLMTPLDSIRYYMKFLRSGFMAMEPETGAVKAYVGGVDFGHFQYDMCMQGRRQVGSTIKPFLYALAMKEGMDPCTLVPNERRSYHSIPNDSTTPLWTPRGGGEGGMITLRSALASSNNAVSAWLISQLGPPQFVSMLRTFGIETSGMMASMALCLGPCDISVAEMVSGYTTFPNGGIRTAPLLVTRIEDSDGNVLAKFTPRMNEVISSQAAGRMLDMMQAVVNEGTGRRLRGEFAFTAPIGGKTGTTNDNSDAWFIGYVPRLVAGCWVGGESRKIHFNSMAYGQGSRAAMPIWGRFMRRVFADQSLGYRQTERFTYPVNYIPCGQEAGDSLEVETPIDMTNIFD